ncbi:diacylglycerol/lipid kinase family protein [Gordonia sp. NPDC003429]
MTSNGERRVAAVAALALGGLAVVLVIVEAIEEFPRGLIAFVVLVIAALLALVAALNVGRRRVAAFTGAVIAAIATLVLLVSADAHLLIQSVVIIVLFAGAMLAASVAFRISVPLPDAQPPRHPVMFFNPKSGGGKAERFNLAEEAGRRGYRAVELTAGSDLRELAENAIADGADALAMAGGDGSQAVIAEVAAHHALPYACIPAGTRNHFALDLGVDRDDVVGALDAFVRGGERHVDLGDVNGQVFVNNVSLGVYAEAVQQKGYRDAKLRTLLDIAPQVLGPDGDGPQLTWHSPGGTRHSSVAAVLVSNNRYRLGRVLGSGTRPSIDDGELGITVLADPLSRGGSGRPQRLWREWSAATFEIDADRSLPAGIDGEADTLEPPLRFTVRPGVLRVRIARQHPGASPSAALPDGLPASVAALIKIALGRQVHTGPRHRPDDEPDPSKRAQVN